VIATGVEAAVAAIEVVVCGGNAQRCSEDCGDREEMHGDKDVLWVQEDVSWACVSIAADGGSLTVRTEFGKATQKEDTKTVTAFRLQNDSTGE
jgi:hypothetical protein